MSTLFKASLIDLKEYRFKRNNHEIVAAKGKLVDNKRPVFVVGAYAQPAMKKDKRDSLMETITSLITKVKSELRNPILIITGDFKQFQLFSNNVRAPRCDLAGLWSNKDRIGSRYCLHKPTRT